MKSLFATTIFALILGACISTTVRAQVSVEEAERRLQEKLAQKQLTTQPVSELDKLRQENLRLRERVMNLEQEVTVLKGSLARASADARQSGPTTKPSPTAEATADALQKPLLGHWRGGDITTGSGYLLTFKPDGTYQQFFTTTNKSETGEYRVYPDSTMEMWGEKWPEDKKHNQYQVTSTLLTLTLTPVVLDGAAVKTPKAVVLTKAE